MFILLAVASVDVNVFIAFSSVHDCLADSSIIVEDFYCPVILSSKVGFLSSIDVSADARKLKSSPTRAAAAARHPHFRSHVNTKKPR